MEIGTGLLVLALVLAALLVWRLWPSRRRLSPLGQEMLRWVMVLAIALGIYSFG